MLIILGLGAPKSINISPVGIKKCSKIGTVLLWEANRAWNAGNVNNSGVEGPKIINSSLVGIKKYSKKLVMLIMSLMSLIFGPNPKTAQNKDI